MEEIVEASKTSAVPTRTKTKKRKEEEFKKVLDKEPRKRSLKKSLRSKKFEEGACPH